MSLTRVGRRATCTQSKDVMFQFNKDLFLFSFGEERNEEVDLTRGSSAMASIRTIIYKFRYSWELESFPPWVFVGWTCSGLAGRTVTPDLGLLFAWVVLSLACAHSSSLFISSAVFGFNPSCYFHT